MLQMDACRFMDCHAAYMEEFYLKRALSKRDIWIIAVVLVLALICLLAFGLPAGGAPEQAEVVIKVEGREYARLPLKNDTIVIRQGEGMENEVVITENGVYMLRATCPNQDCVLQGEVTLDNRDLRPLGNLIVCLPHHITVELIGGQAQ